MDPKRSRPLIALRARLNALESTNDPSGFRADEVAAEIEELLAYLVTPDGVDLEVLSVLGTVYFVRAAAPGSDEERAQDWQLSVLMLWPLCLSRPEDVAPAVLQSFLELRGEPLPEGDERTYEHAEALTDLSMFLLNLQYLGNQHFVPVAIGLLRDALATVPADRPSRAIMLCNLGFGLIAQRRESNDSNDFDEVIELFRESIDQMSADSPDYARATYGLAAATRAKALLSEDQELFLTAIELYRTAIDKGPSIEDALDLMSDFAEALTIQARITPDSRHELLREAIGIQREIMDLLPEPAPLLQAQLGAALLEAREAGAEDVTIGEAVALLEQAATGFPQDTAEHAETMSLLYRAYAVRAREQSIKRRGPKERALDDLMSRAIPPRPGAQPEDPAGMMAVLAKLLGLMPSTDDSRHAQLMDFGATVMKYPHEAGLLEVQAKGMAVLRQQMAHLSPAEQLAELLRMANAPEEPMRMQTDTTGLDEVADLLDQVLAGPQEELEPVDRTLALMSRHKLRLVLAAASGDTERIVAATHESMQILPEQMAAINISVSMIEPMVMLSGALLSPFETLRNLEQDVRIHRERLAENNDLDARKGLAQALFMHFQLTNDEAVYQEAVDNARIVVSATSPPDVRTVANWAATAASRAHNGSIEGGGGGGGMAGMASNQAVSSIIRNDGPGALEGIEDGRALMLSSAFNARRELESLRKVDPGLAAEFTEVRQRARDMYRPGTMPAPPDIERFQALAEEWKDLVERIKGLPDFDRFMVPLPLGLSDLKPAAAEGPIVTINVNAQRCDAIVLGTEGVRLVPLPDLQRDDLAERADRFHAALRVSNVDEREPVLRTTLEWMWDVVAEPVLDALGFSGTPTEWPRLWWSPTGALNFLPVHAAGRHDEPGMSVMDRVVSSYTPTIRALMYSRAGVPQQWRTALAVAMPETPGHADLPATRIEAESLAGRMPGPLPVIGPEATRSAVLYALPHASIAHFACHASSDPADPSASHLLLHDGPLDVATISQLSLETAELAYLSACGTARGGVRYANEAVHVASAFQLAGFSQVVATLWEIGDEVAAATASSVHHEISAMINDPVRIPGAAILHKVTRRMRDAWPKHPSTWAAYVHSGA
jgi:tetratricopeptide (TPR) repeat protein